jgi:hypothetical protein
MPPDIDQHSFFATNAIFFLPLKTSRQDDCLTLAKKKASTSSSKHTIHQHHIKK